MLDARAKALLKTLVEMYIADGQPVGSRTLSKQEGVDLSAATIRNVMADLEELGLVTSPHTSAGRIPTPKGYRIFVDTLLVLDPIQEERTEAIQEHLQADEPQRLLISAAHLLSQLSRFVGVVSIPRRATQFSQIEFVRLSDERILLIIVTPEGNIQNRILSTDRDYSPSQLTEAANYLNVNFAGLDFNTSRAHLQSELVTLRQDIDELMKRALEASQRALSQESDPFLVSGERNLLGISDFSEDLSHLKMLFELFDKKTELMQILEASSHAQGVQIFIGGESDLMPVDQVSLVTAPYEHGGRVVGTLGVIGPTRMDYERVIPIVDVTARVVSWMLSHPSGAPLASLK